MLLDVPVGLSTVVLVLLAIYLPFVLFHLLHLTMMYDRNYRMLPAFTKVFATASLFPTLAFRSAWIRIVDPDYIDKRRWECEFCEQYLGASKEWRQVNPEEVKMIAVLASGEEWTVLDVLKAVKEHHNSNNIVSSFSGIYMLLKRMETRNLVTYEMRYLDTERYPESRNYRVKFYRITPYAQQFISDENVS